jgi:hypothetical protein
MRTEFRRHESPRYVSSMGGSAESFKWERRAIFNGTAIYLPSGSRSKFDIFGIELMLPWL